MISVLPPPPAFGAPVPQTPSDEVLSFMATRRSASALDLRAPAPDGHQIQDLLRLATRAPDHGKLAPWRFVILEGDSKTRFADRLAALATARGDDVAVVKLGKLRVPPLCIAVISSPRVANIDEWEQVLSAGAVCTGLLYACGAMGFGANWITDWYAYDPDATAVLGLAPAERVAGYLMIGTATTTPLERVRPDLARLVTRWDL